MLRDRKKTGTVRAAFASRPRIRDRLIECIARAREVCLRLFRPAFHRQALDAQSSVAQKRVRKGFRIRKTCALAAPSRPARAILAGTAAPRALPRAIAARPLE